MKTLLKNSFGYSEFRPLQAEIIQNVLDKNDSFVLMPTGGGKSICYQLPALKLEGITLVLSPLISLMKDQVDSLKSNGIPAEYLNSSLSRFEEEDIMKRVQNNEVKILYIAPERLALDSFQEYLKSIKIDLIAIDEAHCISEWGHDFRPEYRNLKTLKTQFAGIPIIALTATATPKVQQDILEQLHLENPKIFISSFHRENLELSVLNKKNTYQKLLNILKKYQNESVIMYCFSRKETEDICAQLKEDGYKAKPYHAGLKTEERKTNQNLFINDEVDIMVATIAFGMGIDKPDVRLVVHYTYPKSLEGYYQEIGRAGRDGLPSKCVLFFSHADTRKHQFFSDQIKDNTERRRVEKTLKNVIHYAETRTCRTKYILKYFGEDFKDNCGHCDTCLQETEMFHATEITQKILSCVMRTGNRFGAGHIIEILRGSRKQKIIDLKHHTLSVYGIVSDFSHDELKHIMGSILEKGLLVKSSGEYPTIKITEKGQQFLKNKETIELPKPICEKEIHETRYQRTLDYKQDLFEQLRTLRKSLAEKLEVPPFVIFSDMSLQHMAYFLPKDKESFIKIHGVGEQKLEKFGDVFLDCIHTYASENNCESREIPNTLSLKRTSKHVNVSGSHYQKTKNMIIKKMSIPEMAKAHGFTENTIIAHIEKLKQAGEVLDLEYLKKDIKDFKTIYDAFLQCGHELLKPVFQYLEEKYSYDEIRLVRLFFL
jgi:ATP-dependent DNA helicase RecQ